VTLAAHPEFEADGSFAHLKLGRVAPDPTLKALKLADYLDDATLLPQIPDTCDYTTKVPHWPMYGNDRLGDCTIAAASHMVQAWTSQAGREITPSTPLTECAYWETGSPPSSGGVAGGPTDTGRVEQNVLGYWRKTGIAGHKIGAFAKISPDNIPHVKAGIYLFGGVYTGAGLPLTAQGQQKWDYDPSGGSDAEPGSWGGHAIPDEQYDDDGYTVVTWGALLRATWAFHEHYVDEVWAVISNDFLTGGKTVAGFDAQQLASDLRSIES
jgi:hypothetical protein